MCTGYDLDCPASAANAVAAAFQTNGYYVMSDLIFQLAETPLGVWAPFLYIASVASALLMLALGQPPKIYIWFLVGPAIFKWLLFTTSEVKGVAWNVAGRPQNQSFVWRIAEAGLLNTNIVQAKGQISGTDTPQKWGSNDKWGSNGEIQVRTKEGPSTGVFLPTMFLNFDSLISGQVQALSAWTGIYNQEQYHVEEGTTLPKKDFWDGGADAADQGVVADSAWSILSNSKWPMLEGIVGVTMHNQDMRDSFLYFMASECGDLVSEIMHKENYINASHAKGGFLPKTVFGKDSFLAEDFKKKLVNNANHIPIPVPLRDLAKNAKAEAAGSKSSFKSFYNAAKAEGIELESLASDTNVLTHIQCDAFLYILVQGFRWEAAHAYNQIIREGSEYGMNENQVLYSFLYGWTFKKDKDDDSKNALDRDKRRHFVQNMILMYLFRNEFALASGLPTLRWSTSKMAVKDAESYQRDLGSKAKYGEFYSWAKLIPYLQGVLLYVLTIAYPFACVMMVIPGWWKVIFTWMGFMAWAKSWDLGFAIVMTIERSIWGMLGNNDNIANMNGRILQLEELGKVKVHCPEHDTPWWQGGGFWDWLSGGDNRGCAIPDVTPEGSQTMDHAFELFDKGLLLSGALRHDVSNSYYVYLMSALYFAVPAVTGQVLLGAKAGAASMVSNMIGSSASRVGEASSSGAASDFQTRAQNAMQMVDQTAFAKSMRGGDGKQFLDKAFNAQNNALNLGADRELKGLQAQRNNDRGNILEWGLGSQTRAINARTNFWEAMIGTAQTANGGAGQKMVDELDAHGNPTGKKIPAGGGGGGGGSGASATAISLAMAQGMNRLYGSSGEWRVFGNYADQRAELLRQNIGLGNDASQAGMLQSGEQAMGSRYQQAAQQAAQEQAYTARRNFAFGATRTAAAKGGLAGQLTAGQKPTSMEGMAGTGMLGNDALNLFNYPAQGYQDKVNKGMNEIRSLYAPGSFQVQHGNWAQASRDTGAGFAEFYQGNNPGVYQGAAATAAGAAIEGSLLFQAGQGLVMGHVNAARTGNHAAHVPLTVADGVLLGRAGQSAYQTVVSSMSSDEAAKKTAEGNARLNEAQAQVAAENANSDKNTSGNNSQ